MEVFKGQYIVLVPTVGTYIELSYIKHVSVNKCQHFEGIVLTLCIFMMLYNALKGFPSVPCGKG